MIPAILNEIYKCRRAALYADLEEKTKILREAEMGCIEIKASLAALDRWYARLKKSDRPFLGEYWPAVLLRAACDGNPWRTVDDWMQLADDTQATRRQMRKKLAQEAVDGTVEALVDETAYRVSEYGKEMADDL